MLNLDFRHVFNQSMKTINIKSYKSYIIIQLLTDQFKMEFFTDWQIYLSVCSQLGVQTVVGWHATQNGMLSTSYKS